ncbi:MAG: HNH endonuclease [Deltaproteobacteria bacterium]|nr:HNH endonuclease [Deltaproteobacteria bacterium]
MEKNRCHCHFCGDPVSLRKRGYRRQRADGAWEVDHVVQRRKGGLGSIDNYLPACTSCNRLRWHRTGAALRELLLLGIIAKSEIERLTVTGKELVRVRAEHVRRAAIRRKRRSVDQLRLRDPVLIEQVRQEDRNTLIQFLRKHLKRSFTAAELSRHTGVAKERVRRLLETSVKVSINGHGGRYTFQSRPPKKRA